MGRILPYKVGICKECKRPDAKLIGGYCFEISFCYQKRQKARYEEKQKGKEPKKKAPISPISASMAQELKVYRKVRDEYFKENPVCEFPGCESEYVTLHHAKGKIGKLLTDKRFFKSICWPHHRYCEENPAIAQELGLSYKRLDK